jgi:hypothetical protein
MAKPFEIIPGIYCVGGSDLSHPHDALVYLRDLCTTVPKLAKKMNLRTKN